MKQEKVAIFPGSFDPLTFGHLHLIERSSRLFDKVIVLIATNTSKQYCFTVAERHQQIERAIAHLSNVTVEILADQLVAHYAQERHISILVRGVRNTIDFEYEQAIATANQQQYDKLETVLLYADAPYQHLSSSLIKEVARFGGNLEKMVPAEIAEAMQIKMQA